MLPTPSSSMFTLQWPQVMPSNSLAVLVGLASFQTNDTCDDCSIIAAEATFPALEMKGLLRMVIFKEDE